MRLLATLVLLLPLLAPAARAAPLEILAFGDSLVHGYGLPAGEPFPAQLEARLKAAGYEEVSVLNAGNSGDTTAAGLARLDWALAEAPDAAIVVLGANDGLRGIEPSNTYANLDAILAELEGARHSGAAGRHAGAAQSGPGLRRGVRQRLPRAWSSATTRSTTPSFWRAWRRCRR